MKNLADYKDTNTYIQVNSQREMNHLLPMLEEIFKSWGKSNFFADKDVLYIDMCNDSYGDEAEEEDFEVLQAEDFVPPIATTRRKVLADYIHTDTSIKVSSKKDMKALCRLLKEHLIGWEIGGEYFEPGKTITYVNLKDDQCDEDPEEYHLILDVADFLLPKEDIVNTYSIY